MLRSLRIPTSVRQYTVLLQGVQKETRTGGKKNFDTAKRQIPRAATVYPDNIVFRQKATSMYRRTLRALLRFPQPHLQRKLHANIREAYEVFRLPQAGFSETERLTMAEDTIALLRAWSVLEPREQFTLFGQASHLTSSSRESHAGT